MPDFPGKLRPQANLADPPTDGDSKLPNFPKRSSRHGLYSSHQADVRTRHIVPQTAIGQRFGPIALNRAIEKRKHHSSQSRSRKAVFQIVT